MVVPMPKFAPILTPIDGVKLSKESLALNRENHKRNLLTLVAYSKEMVTANSLAALAKARLITAIEVSQFNPSIFAGMYVSVKNGEMALHEVTGSFKVGIILPDANTELIKVLKAKDMTIYTLVRAYSGSVTAYISNLHECENLRKATDEDVAEVMKHKIDKLAGSGAVNLKDKKDVSDFTTATSSLTKNINKPESESLPTWLTTVDEFEQWQHQPGTDGSYEFVRGQIIPKPAMKQNELFIASYLNRQFIHTSAFQQGAELLPEIDSYVDGVRKRIPYLTHFTADQKAAIRRGERVNTLFAIEILSDSESHEDVLEKIQDYFDGGAQLVWYIVPKRQRVYAYTAPETLAIYQSTDRITAAPVVAELAFVVGDMFA